MFRQVPLLLLLIFALSLAEVRAQDEPVKPDLRLYVMGNSLTDELSYDNFLKMARAGGKNIALGSLRVPGAPIGWLWSHNLDSGGFTHRPYGNPRKAFAQYTWDAFSFQPFQWNYEKNIQHMPLFMDMLYKNSPDCQVYIYAQWPKNDGGDWVDQWLAPRSEEIMARQEYEDHVTWLRENYKKGSPARLIPVGHAMHILEQKIRAGKVPGLVSMWEAYDDGVHVNNLGNLFVAGTYYATLFGEDPTGLAYDMFNGSEQKITLTPELARQVRRSIWQAVASHPFSGVTSEEALEIVTPSLRPGVAGGEYLWELIGAFGKPPRTWSIAEGKLPEGVTLSTEGRLLGTPAEEGTYEFTAKVTDRTGKSCTRSYEMTVHPDGAPEIVTEKLPALQQGEHTRISLEARSANPPLKWRLAEGSLPKGMHLSRWGQLVGSPGREGKYPVVLEVTDGDKVEPEIARRSFTLSVEAGGEEVHLARKLEKAPRIDGKPEGDPWAFDQKIAKVLQGQPGIEAWIDYAWTDEALYVAVKVQDPQPTGKRWNLEGTDQVRIYFDGQNNREKTYNWDDLILKANPAGATGGQGRTFRTSIQAGKIEGGYLVEAKVPFGNLGHKVSKRHNLSADWVCVGLDVMILDVDPETGKIASRTVWKGTGENDSDPSGFATVIMKP